MSKDNIIQPKYNNNVIQSRRTENTFSCPFCEISTTQYWNYITSISIPKNSSSKLLNEKLLTQFVDVYSVVCHTCKCSSIWVNEQMVHPKSRNYIIEAPNDDLPNNIKETYQEAKDIIERSPRAAAILLRLCLEEILKYLSEKERMKELSDKLKDNIDKLKNLGVNENIIEELNIIRTAGNTGAHPKETNLNKNPEIVLFMFETINNFAYQIFTQNKRKDEISNILTKEKNNIKHETNDK